MKDVMEMMHVLINGIKSFANYFTSLNDNCEMFI